MGLGVVKAAPQLDRFVVVGAGQAFHAQKRRSRFHLQQLGRRGIGRNSPELLFGADHAHPKFGFEQPVHGTAVFAEPLGSQPFEKVTGQPDVIEHHGHTAKQHHAAHLDNAIARLQLERTAHVGRGAQAPAVDHAARDIAGIAVVRHEAKESELDLLFGVGGDEGALALAAHDEVFVRQGIDGLAHRALAHLVASGQLGLARDHFARPPFAGLQAAGDQRLDLLVQRAERRTFGGRVDSSRGKRRDHDRDCSTSPSSRP